MLAGQPTLKPERIERVMYKPNPRAKSKRQKLCFVDIETKPNTDNQVIDRIKFKNHLKEIFTFRKPDEFWEEIKKKKYRDCWIFAHNLLFDFFGMQVVKRESSYKCFADSGGLMFAVTYLVDGKFDAHPEIKKRKHKLTFVDTLNYAGQSLKALGDDIELEKLEWDFSSGLDQDTEEFDLYSLRDVEILEKFVHLLNDVVFELGGTLQKTIAGTAENIFRRGYLKGCYFQMPHDTMKFIFRAFFGGMCQTFQAGLIKDVYYYDFTSMYPWIMLGLLPDPNTYNDIKQGTLAHIKNFEGVCEVEVDYPYVDKPVLPVKDENSNNKTIYPYGVFKGVWTHHDIRAAMEDGATIMSIGRCVYFTGTCRPYKEYVEDIFERRMQAKNADKPALAYIYKILMNSLFGKSTQKFGQEEDSIYHMEEISLEFLQEHPDFKTVGDYVFIKSIRKARSFCIPIWGTYITSIGRQRIFEYAKKYDAISCDTDSIKTKHQLPTGKNIGEFKLEKYITEGYEVKPKMYAMNCDDELIKNPVTKKDSDHNEKIHKKSVKCKGFPGKCTYHDFKRILTEQTFDAKKGKIIIHMGKVQKFIKYKESIRRNIPVNSVIVLDKTFSLDDDKRVWDEPFNMNCLIRSKPCKMINGALEKYILSKRSELSSE